MTEIKKLTAKKVLKNLQVPGGKLPTLPNAEQAGQLAKAEPGDQAELWEQVIEEHGESVTAAKVRTVVGSFYEEWQGYEG